MLIAGKWNCTRKSNLKLLQNESLESAVKLAGWRCCVKKVFLKISQISQENACVKDYFFKSCSPFLYSLKMSEKPLKTHSNICDGRYVFVKIVTDTCCFPKKAPIRNKNLTVFWCFQGVEEGYIRNKWVNKRKYKLTYSSDSSTVLVREQLI